MPEDQNQQSPAVESISAEEAPAEAQVEVPAEVAPEAESVPESEVPAQDVPTE